MAENTNTERDYPPLPEPAATGLGDEYEAFDRNGRPMGMAYETIVYFKADQMRAYVDADREARASLPAAGQEPVAHQYLGADGEWHDFIDARHCKNTIESGLWQIRPLYAAPQPAVAAGCPLIARALHEWHEDDGPVMWWAWNGNASGWAGEPAWCGTPLSSNWPGYHTHWTPHPTFPPAPSTEGESNG